MLNVFHTGSVFFLASYIKDNFNGNHLVNTVFYKVLANLFLKKKRSSGSNLTGSCGATHLALLRSLLIIHSLAQGWQGRAIKLLL